MLLLKSICFVFPVKNSKHLVYKTWFSPQYQQEQSTCESIQHKLNYKEPKLVVSLMALLHQILSTLDIAVIVIVILIKKSVYKYCSWKGRIPGT